MGKSKSKPEPDYTEEELQAFVGKSILVGITKYTLEGAVESLEQFHGTIIRFSFKEGIVIKLNGSNEERTVPPSKLEMASPGEYRLRTSGEIVIDPDYLSTWSVYPKGYKAKRK